MGRLVWVPSNPQRVVSLVPSQTELLVELGLGDRLVGVTDYCTEPASALADTVRIGGTKRFLFDRIKALTPDLIIGNLEENYREGVEQLASLFPVWMSDIASLEQNCEMIRSVGELVNLRDQAELIAERTEQAFNKLESVTLGRAAYLIWRKPWMAAASGTFIDAMMTHAGFENAFADCDRYPEVSLEMIAERAPDWVLLSNEPFPFTSVHVEELSHQLPASRVIIVDAMPFSWYGSRMQHAAAYFVTLQEQLNASKSAPPIAG